MGVGALLVFGGQDTGWLDFPRIRPLVQARGTQIFALSGGNLWNSIQPILFLSFPTKFFPSFCPLRGHYHQL